MIRRSLLFIVLGLAGSLSAQTYEASSFERDNVHPRLAFDGDKSTRWSVSFKEKAGWIQVSFAEAKRFSEVRIFSGIKDLKGAPKDFDVLAGDDAAHLTLLKSVKDLSGDDQVIAFPQKNAKVWRIDVKKVIDARWSPTISEITFGPADASAENLPAPAPAAGERKIRASDAGLAGRTPEKAFDDDPRSAFEFAAESAKEWWIEIEYPEPAKWNAVRIMTSGENGRGVPEAFRVEARTGGSYTSLATVEASCTPDPATKFKETTAKIFRIVFTKMIRAKSAPRIDEIRFLAVDGEIPPLPDPAAPTETEVNKAIERGVNWLKKERQASGNWKTPHTEEFPTGVMALAGLALRKSGVDAEDPILQEIVAALSKVTVEKEKTYSLAVYMNFLKSLSMKKHVDRIKECADFLIKKQAPDGLWGYPDGRSDLSNAQFALLGLKTAIEVGIEVPGKVWSKALDYFVSGAEKDGGFNYVPTGPSANEPSTGSMTAAALACIKMCMDFAPKEAMADQKTKAVRERALEWLDRRFTVALNPNSDQSHYYYLYAIERVGAFYRLKEFGGHPWYALGARHLVDRQSRDGSWHGNVEDTCFALLFLNRASVTGH